MTVAGLGKAAQQECIGRMQVWTGAKERHAEERLVEGAAQSLPQPISEARKPGCVRLDFRRNFRRRAWGGTVHFDLWIVRKRAGLDHEICAVRLCRRFRRRLGVRCRCRPDCGGATRRPEWPVLEKVQGFHASRNALKRSFEYIRIVERIGILPYAQEEKSQSSETLDLLTLSKVCFLAGTGCAGHSLSIGERWQNSMLRLPRGGKSHAH